MIGAGAATITYSRTSCFRYSDTLFYASTGASNDPSIAPLPSALAIGTGEVVSVEAMLNKGVLDYDFGLTFFGKTCCKKANEERAR